MNPPATDRPAPTIPDAAMRALIEHVLHWHREAAQGHERAGRRQLAEREYETVRRIERYLAPPSGSPRAPP